MLNRLGFIAVLFNIRLLYHRFFVSKHAVLAAGNGCLEV